MPENNIHISGDEARILMVALLGTNASMPVGPTLQLYMKLAQLSNVQPSL